MNRTEANKRIAKLRDDIRRHDHLYYVEARPEISDFDYDKLYSELQKLEASFPDLVTPDSPTQRVGGGLRKKTEPVIHKLPMLSLEKVAAADSPTRDEEPVFPRRVIAQDRNTLPELRRKLEQKEKELGVRQLRYVLEPKVDGASISVHYHNGILTQAATRGTGDKGDDITANVRTVKSVPLKLNTPKPPVHLEVRGEAYMPVRDFEKFNAEQKTAGRETFENPRNATAGTLLSDNPSDVARCPIRTVFYAVGVTEGVSFNRHSEMLTALKDLGLPVQSVWWICDGIDEVIRHYLDDVVANYDSRRDLRQTLPYEIDGVVIKIDDRKYWESLGATGKDPRYAIVHKPVPWIEWKETLLKDITVQVGRTGVLTPVAELEPVFLAGSTISRATLHNEEEIKRRDIRIGDTVIIRKAGMVIPEVVEAVLSKRPKDSKPFDFVRHTHGKCPACGTPIAKEEIQSPKKGEKKLEAAWRCQNIAGCPAQSVRRIDFFAQRKALDIESLGGVVAEKLVERGLVKEPLDLFDLTVEKLGKLNLGTDKEPRVFGEKNAAKVVEALQRSRNLPLSRWLLASAIPEIGEETARDLAEYFSEFRSLADSPVLRDAAVFGDLLEGIKKHVVAKDWKEMGLSEKEMDSRRQRQRELKEQANPYGERLIKAGFARPSPSKGSAPWQANLLVGPVAVKSLVSWLTSPAGKSTLRRLVALDISPRGGPVKTTHSALTGKTFVLTGTLPTLTRDEASTMIRNAGGSVTGSVSKNTDFVLAGENPGSKLDRAREFGIKILDEKVFRKMFGSVSSKPQKPLAGQGELSL